MATTIPAQRPDSYLVLDADAEKAMVCLELLLHRRTGHYLSDLQRVILRLGLKGKRYLEIADAYGCTEGHAKDVGSQLWRLLSHTLGEKVTKQNLRSAVVRGVQRARGIKRSEPLVPSPISPSMQRLDPAARRLFHWSWEQPC